MKHQRSAFTIIEMLIFMGILSFFLLVLTQIFHTAIEVQLQSSSASSADLAGNYLTHRFEYDIRQADTIMTPALPGLSSSSLMLNLQGVSNTYSVNNGILQVVNSSGTHALTDSSVTASDFQVTRLGTGSDLDSLQITFVLTSTTSTLSDQVETRTYQTTVSLR